MWFIDISYTSEIIMQFVNELLYYSSILVMTYITQKYFNVVDSTIFMIALITMISSFAAIKRDQ